MESDVGLRIFYFPTPGKVAGVFAYNDALGGCIGINSNHPCDRRNWALAHEHEYGRFLTSRYQAEITFLSTSKRSSARERFADTFAECFSMPASGLNHRFTEIYRSRENGVSLADLLALADLYQVSVQALILRLENLRRLPSGTWDKLEREGFKVRRAQQMLGIEADPPVKDSLPLDKLIQSGVLSVCHIEGDSEAMLYVDCASKLDDGEAMSLAIAEARGYILATDDRKARRIFLESVSDSRRLTSSSELIRSWSERLSIYLICKTQNCFDEHSVQGQFPSTTERCQFQVVE